MNCKHCNGTGQVRDAATSDHSTGDFPLKPCPECAGSGEKVAPGNMPVCACGCIYPDCDYCKDECQP